MRLPAEGDRRDVHALRRTSSGGPRRPRACTREGSRRAQMAADEQAALELFLEAAVVVGSEAVPEQVFALVAEFLAASMIW